MVTEAGFGYGLSGLGATGDDDYRFAYVQGSVSRDITKSLSMQLQFAGQHAFTELPSALRFNIGSEPYARAFESGAVSGDDAAGAAFELRQAIKTSMSWLKDLSLFGFVDYGAVWNPPNRNYSFASLGSYGGGVRAVIGKHFNTTAYLAKPYEDEKDLDLETYRFRFALGAQF